MSARLNSTRVEHFTQVTTPLSIVDEGKRPAAWSASIHPTGTWGQAAP